jgi:hypothetical protein
MKAKRLSWLFAIAVLLVASCTAPPQRGGPDAERGFLGMFKGIGHLVLAPFQIAAGLLEGVAALPYYAGTSLVAINEGLAKAQAKVTLDDTYESAYGKRLNQVGPEGDTGEVFRRMSHASQYFQKILKRYGVRDPEHYILTSIDTANRQGATLFAVVYRPTAAITVVDKYDGKTIRRFTSEDRLFYEPFRTDAQGGTLDTIIDWGGLPTDQYQSQKQQAVLLTLAANAVAEGRKRSDYWEAEGRWISGAFQEVMKTQDDKVRGALKI